MALARVSSRLLKVKLDGRRNVESLVLFAKPPVLGKVKTRLAQTLGEADALNVYAALLKDSLSLMLSLIHI